MNQGIIHILISGFCFLIVNFFVKILGAGNTDFGVVNRFPAHELVFFRSVISFSICIYLLKKKHIPILGTNKKWLLIRGFSGMIALTLFFYTIHFLPIAVASTIQYLAPIFTVILAVFIMKEKVKIIQWLFILISFGGAFLIGFSSLLGVEVIKIDIFWLLLGIVSAAFSGLAYVAILKLKATEHTLNIVLYFPMLSIPIMGVWCMFHFVVPTPLELLFLFIIGIFTQFAQISLTKAFQFGNANTISPFQYLGSIYALILGFFVFEESLSLLSYFGISLILFGVLMNVLFRMRKN
jgi:drug/metabolite transporter (DMT)-like permease